MQSSSPAVASAQDGSYPRPQLLRPHWRDLGGDWGFELDHDDTGLSRGLHLGRQPLSRRIIVPFPPESPKSGIHETGYCRVFWYQRELSQEDLAASGELRDENARTLLHFGAIDYRATVWVNGQEAGSHEGGQTPFAIDITEHIGSESTLVVVRAEDDPLDVSQPRGKQDWQLESHAIWYNRTSGIWQPVWLETVPATHIRSLHWETDVAAGIVRAEITLSAPQPAGKVSVSLSHEGAHLASCTVDAHGQRVTLHCSIPRQSNGQDYEKLLWSPEHPRLIDATVTLLTDGGAVDEVQSYLGLRTIAAAGRDFLLNDRPYFIRAVLEQGYWPESNLAAPSAGALRDEVALIKNMGFNCARIHEKVEDPRFLFWADRLGLLVWGEMGSAFEYSADAVSRTVREWTDVVLRDRSHPCIVAWVPLNESWGVQHIAHSRQQQHFARSLADLTRALDGSRPVISNDGWEHVSSDLFTVHDYTTDAAGLAANYGSADAVEELARGIGPAGRRLNLGDESLLSRPLIVSEFGGITFAPGRANSTWGYAVAETPEAFSEHVEALFISLQESPVLAGYCYTQLTDTMQEANGLADENRRPKIPIAEIRRLVLGARGSQSTQVAPG